MGLVQNKISPPASLAHPNNMVWNATHDGGGANHRLYDVAVVAAGVAMSP